MGQWGFCGRISNRSKILSRSISRIASRGGAAPKKEFASPRDIRHRAARDIDAVAFQFLHDGIVGEYVVGALGVDHALDAVAHGFRECASPPSAAAIDEEKKYFNSKMPRGVAMYYSR